MCLGWFVSIRLCAAWFCKKYLVYVAYNDSVSDSKCKASNGRMINELARWTGKGVWNVGLGLFWDYSPGVCAKQLSKMKKILMRISRLSDRNFNFETTANTAVVPTIPATTDCSENAMSKMNLDSLLNPQLLSVNHTSFCLPTNSDFESKGLFLENCFLHRDRSEALVVV